MIDVESCSRIDSRSSPYLFEVKVKDKRIKAPLLTKVTSKLCNKFEKNNRSHSLSCLLYLFRSRRRYIVYLTLCLLTLCIFNVTRNFITPHYEDSFVNRRSNIEDKIERIELEKGSRSRLTQRFAGSGDDFYNEEEENNINEIVDPNGEYTSEIQDVISEINNHEEVENQENETSIEQHAPHNNNPFKGARNARQAEVVDAFSSAWNAYKKYAWGMDNLKPVSGGSHTWFDLSLTLVDSLDTLLIMNLRAEFEIAKKYFITNFDTFFEKSRNVNLFETGIRVLGGLLSAHHLSELVETEEKNESPSRAVSESIFLRLAEQLGDKLLPAFATPSGIPYSDVDLATGRASLPNWSSYSSTAEVSSVQLEFTDLTKVTSNATFHRKAECVSKTIHLLRNSSTNVYIREGLLPIYVDPIHGKFDENAVITLGARGDSYYEYLLKQWLQSEKSIDYFRLDFLTSLRSIRKHLSRRSEPNGLLFIGELTGSRKFYPKMDELACFLPGTIALAYVHEAFESETESLSFLQFGKDLLHTCYMTFKVQNTGLAPEITHFNYNTKIKSSDDNFTNEEPPVPILDRSNGDMYVKSLDKHYLLRPETIESLYYMFYLTHDVKYQNWGYEIFKHMVKFCKVEKTGGFSTIGDVTAKTVQGVKKRDFQESFLMSETFKYLYLLLGDDITEGKAEISLHKWIFNTEAHLLPI